MNGDVGDTAYSFPSPATAVLLFAVHLSSFYELIDHTAVAVDSLLSILLCPLFNSDLFNRSGHKLKIPSRDLQ